MSDEVFRTRDFSLHVFSTTKTIHFGKFDKLIFSEGDDMELIFLLGDALLLQFTFG